MYPVVGKGFKPSDYHHIDLSLSNPDLKNVQTPQELWQYIQQQVSAAGKKVAYGGYGEQRNFYLKSSLFSGDERTLHLGIDVWLPPGTPVFAAKAGIIYGKAYNDKYLDYGYTVIIQHVHEDKDCFSLYGHLGEKDFDQIVVGQDVAAGDCIGFIGSESENGGWAPHLHFQLIHDLEGNVSDYPGVCHTSKASIYLNNCPDPIHWVLN